VVNQVRAMNPWPGAFTYLETSDVGSRTSPERLGIWRTALSGQFQVRKQDGPLAVPLRTEQAGTVLAVEKTGIMVSCGSDAVFLKEVQPSGGRRMTAADYIHGHKIAPGNLCRSSIRGAPMGERMRQRQMRP